MSLKRRLRLQIFDGDSACPCCGECLDKWGDHALSCMCSGDRTVRHNTVRDILYDEAVTGALNPHREKAGLLPPRPSEDGLKSVGEARRLADIWLPRGMQGGPETLQLLRACRQIHIDLSLITLRVCSIIMRTSNDHISRRNNAAVNKAYSSLQ